MRLMIDDDFHAQVPFFSCPPSVWYASGLEAIVRRAGCSQSEAARSCEWLEAEFAQAVRLSSLCARALSELLSGRVFLHTGDRLEYFARLNSHDGIHLLLLSLSKEVQQNRRLVLTRTARC